MKTLSLIFIATFSTALRAHAGDCTAAPPSALLDSTTYKSKSHVFQMEKTGENKAHETATLGGGTSIRIEFDGCEDVVRKSITFKIKKNPHSPSDLKYWADRASKEIGKLKFTKEASPIQSQLLKFLLKAPTLPNLSKNEIDVSECMDGSRPTLDGCSFEQLGKYELRRQKAKKLGEISLIVIYSNNI